MPQVGTTSEDVKSLESSEGTAAPATDTPTTFAKGSTVASKASKKAGKPKGSKKATKAIKKAPKTVKKASKKSAKPAKAKKEPKPKKAKGTRPAKDDARIVAKASDGKLNPDQVRILRVLKAAKKAVDRGDIKEGVGIGRDGKYGASWLKNLWALQAHRPKYITIEQPEPAQGERPKHFHQITKDGKDILETAEKAAKAVKA